MLSEFPSQFITHNVILLHNWYSWVRVVTDLGETLLVATPRARHPFDNYSNDKTACVTSRSYGNYIGTVFRSCPFQSDQHKGWIDAVSKSEEEGRCNPVTYITTGKALPVTRVTNPPATHHSHKWNSTDSVEVGFWAHKMTPCYKSRAKKICCTRNNKRIEDGEKVPRRTPSRLPCCTDL